jgi:hypothetical protein
MEPLMELSGFGSGGKSAKAEKGSGAVAASSILSRGRAAARPVIARLINVRSVFGKEE